MVYIGSIGLGIPEYNLEQEEVEQLVKSIFSENERKLTKLLPIFRNAKVSNRQFVVDQAWFKEDRSFADANRQYFNHAKALSLRAMDECLQNNDFLSKPIEYDAIDLLVFVTSTGIATPSLDAYLLNDRPFREDIVRMPLWGLGCAGGAIGLSRAYEWISLHPDKVALVVCCELCSLTFQKRDMSTSNIVGTAIFGDGVGATVLVGSKSSYTSHLMKNKLKMKATSSFTKKDSTSVMGWNVTNNGFEVIFSKRIPQLIQTVWKQHVCQFLKNEKVTYEDFTKIIAHPGGRKVLEEMENVFKHNKRLFTYSYDVLEEHGNMSSSTVIYVLKKWLEEGCNKTMDEQRGLLCALGPGFSSELALLEWTE